MSFTQIEEVQEINKTFCGQDALCVTAVYAETPDVTIDQDMTSFDVQKFFNGPGDGSVLTAIIKAIQELLIGVGVNCAPQQARLGYRSRHKQPIRRLKARLFLNSRLPQSAKRDTSKIYDLIEQRLDRVDDIRLESMVAEINAPGNDLF